MNLQAMIELAVVAHKGQVDRAKKPFILHPLKVMQLTQEFWGFNETLLTIAVGHDLIEDTLVTEKLLRQQGFSERVIAGINAISKEPGKSYDEYKDKVKENTDAMKVKVADLTHNSDLTRLHKVSEADKTRTAKYLKFKDELLLLLNEVA